MSYQRHFVLCWLKCVKIKTVDFNSLWSKGLNQKLDNKMKKFLIVAAAFICLLQMSAQTFESGGLYYTLNSNNTSECLVTYSPTGLYKGNLAIPSSVFYNGKTYAVSGIGDNAFAGCTELTAIKMATSVKNIGMNAFAGCSSLSSCQAEGAVNLDKNAFYNCNSLYELKLNSGLKNLGDNAFKNCKKLASFIIPKGVFLGNSVFAGCESLESVTIPSGMAEIPDYLFSDCTSLTEVKGTENIVELGEYAFSGCSSLKEFKFGKGTVIIGRGAFSFCSSLNQTSVAGTGLSIGEYAFTGCTSLKTITLAGVVEVGTEAFANCENLTSVTFDSSVSNIKERSFRKCLGIKTVVCYAELPPLMANSALEEDVYEKATLYVPKGKVMLYRQTPPWFYFENVTDKSMESGVETASDDNFSVECLNGTVSVSGGLGNIAVFTEDGVKIMEKIKDAENISFTLPASGLYFIMLNGKTKKLFCR